jgi:hypothetical protein
VAQVREGLTAGVLDQHQGALDGIRVALGEPLPDGDRLLADATYLMGNQCP